jgi:regulator of protease activity HflC (stomatin/prohibitin superfamily)
MNSSDEDFPLLLDKELNDFSNPMDENDRNNDDNRELTLNDVIIKSTLYDPNYETQRQNVLSAFNKNKVSIMEESVAFGTRIPRNSFRLVHRNNIPELVGFTNVPLRKKVFTTGTTEDLGTFNQTDLHIGAHSSHLINVPQGFVAKAFHGNKYPLLLGEGPHVIHDNTFKIVGGKDACLVKLNTSIIVNGTLFILRIPKGKIAKIWMGSEPYLLSSREDPYVFKSPYFSIQPVSEEVYFEDASTPVIIHGPIKRLIPKTGEVAITYNNGNLVTYEADPNMKPILITDENHTFNGFLATNIQTIEFPCERTKILRRKENPNNIDFVNYEEFRTKDGLPIGVKLLVVYSIFDPVKALSKLNKNQIETHIEKLVVADMGAVVQRCSSGDFQNTNMTKTTPHIRDELLNTTSANNDESLIPPNNPQLIVFLQDSMKNKLTEDFKEYGIELVRVNIETPKILDKTIADKIAENSILTSATNAKESMIDQKYKIAKKEAEQLAIQIEIKQKQENENMINAARAKLEAAKLIAEAKYIEADAIAKSEKKIFETKAKLYKRYPHLFQYDMSKLQTDRLRSVKTTVISPEVAKSVFGFGSQFANQIICDSKDYGESQSQSDEYSEDDKDETIYRPQNYPLKKI